MTIETRTNNMLELKTLVNTMDDRALTKLLFFARLVEQPTSVAKIETILYNVIPATRRTDTVRNNIGHYARQIFAFSQGQSELPIPGIGA